MAATVEVNFILAVEVMGFVSTVSGKVQDRSDQAFGIKADEDRNKQNLKPDAKGQPVLYRLGHIHYIGQHTARNPTRLRHQGAGEETYESNVTPCSRQRGS